MDSVGVGLALTSIVLFVVTLGLSTRLTQVKPVNKKRLTPFVNNSENDPKTIVVKLPHGESIPDDYILDLKVSLSKAKAKVEGEMEKGDKIEERGKKFYRRLDEYL